jgi:hypothetical protein
LGFSNWPVIYYIFPRQPGTEIFYRRCRVLKKKLSHHHHRATTCLFIRGRISTVDRLAKRTLPHNDKFVFYKIEEENAQHLFP